MRILTGFVEPHFFAGFSGGPKAVLPGIADIESILDNHGARLLSDPKTTWTVTAGNPLWEEIRDAALATQPTFVLNVVLNRDERSRASSPARCCAHTGPRSTSCEGTRCGRWRKPFDIVITSNSGYPLDLNLYQAVKGMSAAAQIVKPGGDIIIAAECWDGLPDHGEYGRLLREASSPAEMLAAIKSPGFRCHDQWEAQIQAQIQAKATVHVYADGLSDQQLSDAMVVPCRSIEELCGGAAEGEPRGADRRAAGRATDGAVRGMTRFPRTVTRDRASASFVAPAVGCPARGIARSTCHSMGGEWRSA